MKSADTPDDHLEAVIAGGGGIESHVDLLQKIDHDVRKIFEGTGSLDSLIYNALLKLRPVVDVDHVEFLLGLNGEWTRIHAVGSGIIDWAHVLSRSPERALSWEEGGLRIIDPATENTFPYVKGISAILFNRVRFPDLEREAIFVMEVHDNARSQLLRERRVQQIVAAVAVQIQNAFELNALARKRLSDSEILKAFFDKELKPSQCLKELVLQIQHALPSLSALKLNPPPEVQILLYKPGDKFLTIRATTGVETNVTRLNVEDSVCGYLIENPGLNYYPCDPETEPRYKWYLGRDMGKRMRSELAVPIRDKDGMVGVLNFESELPNAFTGLHIRSACRVATEFCVWIRAIRDRLETGWAKEYALNTVMTGYITGFSRLIRHNVGNAASAAVLNTEVAINVARTKGTNLDEETLRFLETGIKNGRQVGHILDSLVDDLKDFSGRRCHSIKGLISAAINVIADVHNLAVARDVSILGPVGDDCDVFCSKIFRQHIYNVLDNSVMWIRRRLETQLDPTGVIEIAVSSFTTGEQRQEREFNRRCRIVIRDNGTGVQPEHLSRLKAFEDWNTRRQCEDAHGYGLFALRQYLNSINGWVDIDSKVGEYFEVTILLDIFNPILHTENQFDIRGR